MYTISCPIILESVDPSDKYETNQASCKSESNESAINSATAQVNILHPYHNDSFCLNTRNFSLAIQSVKRTWPRQSLLLQSNKWY